MWQVFSKNLRNQRTLRHQKNSSIIILNYSIIAQKLPMIKQGVKTMNAEFIWTHALFQLTFIRLLLFLTLMPKSKKTLETSLNLLPLFKTSLDARVRALFWMWIMWKIGTLILLKEIWKKMTPGAHTHFVFWTIIFLFVQTF